MAANSVTRSISNPDHPIDIVNERLQQAQAIVTTIDVLLTDRLDGPERDQLNDSVLEKLAWSASVLLEQAEQAFNAVVKQPQPRSVA